MIEENQVIEIKVPASTANLGPGFDSLGLALPLYLTIRMKLADKNTITLYGEHLEDVPTDESNLIYQCIKRVVEQESVKLPPLAIEVESEIPLSRGLGSSGTAIVGGLVAGNQLLQEPKSMEELLQIATEIEGHADNVGASLYGGFVVTAWDGQQAKLAKVPFPKDLRIMVAIPHDTLATSKARSQIPESIPLKDVSYNIGHASLLVTYLATGQLDKIASAMRDRVHQPYRQNMVKGLKRILEETEKKGMFGAALSGAGPTILLFLQEDQVNEAEQFVQRIATEEWVDMDIKTLSFAEVGTSVQILSKAEQKII